MSSHIEYQRFRRDESCSEEGCRARKYYIESGKKFCQRGHEQAGFTQTQQDEDDWNAQGKKSRKRREEKERVETILSGSEAKELYLQCYQLILWKQCHWLVTALGLPEELKVVVRDLWALRIRVLPILKDDKAGYGSVTSTTMFSSQSEGENTDTDATTRRSLGSRKSSKHRRIEEQLPTLIQTLSISYLAMLLLKLPVSLGDVYKWATQDRLLYTRAIKEVPKEMRSRLPAHYHSALEIRAPLEGSALYRSVQGLIEFYSSEFGMEIPNLNTPLLLFKYMRDIYLPVEIYGAVRRLANLLEIDFSYPIQRSKSSGLTNCPEIQLVSLIVIATKLAYPFDDTTRVPQSYSDPSAVAIDWDKWIKATRDEPPKGLKRGEEIKVMETEVWDMDAQMLDDYLDWYQQTWIDDRDPKITEQILQLFPIEDPPSRPLRDHTETEQTTVRLKAVQESLVWRDPRPIIEGEESGDLQRAGDLYKRYRTVEELPQRARPFFELAASKAGLSLKMLVRYVFRLEVQLENWRLAQRKKETMVSD